MQLSTKLVLPILQNCSQVITLHRAREATINYTVKTLGCQTHSTTQHALKKQIEKPQYHV